MSNKEPTESPAPEPTPPTKSGPFKYFQRRPKGERAQSGRVLPPAPAWMQKPLKPPGVRFRNDA